MVDAIVVLIIIFFVFVGWCKGFWQYLLGLLITALSLWVGWFHYQQGQEILKSLLVFVWVLFCLSLLKWFLLRIRRKRLSPHLTSSFANQFCGATLGFIWGKFVAILFILALELLPSETIFKYNIKQVVRNSRAHQIIQRILPVKKIAIIENISYMGKVSLDEQAKLRLSKQARFQELLKHESLKTVMEDPQLLRQLQNKDLPRLLTNPKILNLLNDGQFVEKLLKLDFKKAQEE